MPSLATGKMIVIAAILAAFGFLLYDRLYLKNKIADQRTEIVQLQDANSAFAADVAKQNKAIEDEQKMRAAMEQRYQLALKQAEAETDKSKKEQSAIMSQKVTGDHCVYAHNLLTGFMKGRHP